MNSLVIVLVSLILFWLGYKFYAKKIENLYALDPNRPTPAVSKFDGVDYVPAKNCLVLFGHHFASIAGAGPIIGPVIAVILWGWLPALIWIIIGAIFIGGVHDFGALAISVREHGNSIADIAEHKISKKAKIVFSLFVWLALILVIAVFAYLCADTFVNEPKIVLPSLGLIPVAILIGFLFYNLKINSILVTVLGLSLLVFLLFLGQAIPITLGKNSLAIWLIILLIYCYFASILPVNLLLQPRDYLSSFLLFFGVIAGFFSLFIMHPAIKTPAFIQYKTQEGSLWPMLCVTVACGAISGFHALIASGTTSKQIANERHVKRISYGAMIMEALVAILALICICAGLNLADISTKANPIGLFGKGYGNITNLILCGFGGFIAITILNAFILTTLDTATRITRYLTEELFHIKNRFLSTFIIIILGGWLGLTKDKFGLPLWKKIWPAFGASNQLVAALALLVISAWLLSHKKPTRYTLIPAIFMLVTTLAALSYQVIRYLNTADYLLFTISLALIGLSLFMVREIILVYRKVKIK